MSRNLQAVGALAKLKGRAETHTSPGCRSQTYRLSELLELKGQTALPQAGGTTMPQLPSIERSFAVAVASDTVGRRRSTIARSKGEGRGTFAPTPERSSLALVTPFVRVVRLVHRTDDVLRVLRPEEVEDFVRDRFGEHPRRTLRFDRTSVRPAKVSAYDLSADAQLLGDLLGPISDFVRHSFDPFARGASFERRMDIMNDRTNECNSLAKDYGELLTNDRSSNVCSFVRVARADNNPPLRPPRRDALTWRRVFCRAKRAGCEIFSTFSAAYVGGIT